jgi:hypothetical protein
MEQHIAFFRQRHIVPVFELTKPHTAKVNRVPKNSLQAKTNKQRNTKMKPSLKRNPCHAHESPGEEEELQRTSQRKPMPPSTIKANHADRPLHL